MRNFVIVNIRLSQEDLLEYRLPCGHSGYHVDLEFYADDLGDWVPIASLRDFNLDAAVALLRQAQQCIVNLRG